VANGTDPAASEPAHSVNPRQGRSWPLIQTVHPDEAFDALLQHLAQIGLQKNHRGERLGAREADFYLPDFVWNFWLPHLDRSGGRYMNDTELEQERFTPFYDAAWELCRIGVLRPGEFAPRGRSHPKMFGDQYVITAFGREWLQSANERPVIGSSRLAQLLNTFSGRFGDGYAQRASEAVKTYQTANWLAASVMAGAAAESVLIALAIEKSGDEKKVLSTYNGPSGRSRTTKLLLEGVRPSLQQHLENALLVLQYWRDSASHGLATSITEIEAHASLMQLLRLAQFADKNWDPLTSRS
jgi:hypothetical protein